MSKSIKYNFSDDSFDKIFDIESIKRSIKKYNKLIILRNVLIVISIIILIILLLQYNGKEEELE